MMEWGILVDDKVKFKASQFVQEKAEWTPGNSIQVFSSSKWEKMHLFLSPSILKSSKGVASKRAYWEKYQHTKGHGMMQEIKSYLRNRRGGRDAFVNGDDLRIPQKKKKELNNILNSASL